MADHPADGCGGSQSSEINNLHVTVGVLIVLSLSSHAAGKDLPAPRAVTQPNRGIAPIGT